MINYHRKFIRNLSSILQPLNQLLQKDQEFWWSPQCEEAFNKAKESLSSSHVLVHYNPSLPVILESDASQYGIGAVILHRFPNAYASRSLNSSEKNYSQIEKEGLAIIFGVTKYYMYLFWRKFTLRTDHKPLLKIFAPDSATPVLAAARLQRWSLLLSSYQYEIEFKPFAEVASSDALSRLPMQYRKDASVEDKIFQVSAIQLRKHPVSVLEIARQTARNPVLAKALAVTQNGLPIHFCTTPELKPFFLRRDELSVEQGCLMWGLRTIIPPSLREQILSELHKAHPGVARMKAAARSHVWWPGIEERARGCKQCFKTRKAPQEAPLFPWSWPTTPWQRIHIDFATHQSNHYLIVVDAHSEWPEVIGPMNTTTAEATANAGTVVQHPSSHSCRVHLDDGRVWRRHVDDILQNNSRSKRAESGVPSLETATPLVPDPQPVISSETSSHPPDNSVQLETTPASTSPVLRRSSRSHRPPQRLIEEM